MPPKPREELKPITIDNFSPGIYSNWYAGSTGMGQQVAPNGSAQLTGTLGCVSNKAGGLVAGPRIVASYKETLPDNTAAFPTGERRMAIHGLRNLIPSRLWSLNAITGTFPTSWNWGTESTLPDTVGVIFSYYCDTAAATNFKQNMKGVVYKFSNPSITSTIVDTQEQGTNFTAPWTYGAGYIDVGRSTIAGTTLTAINLFPSICFSFQPSHIQVATTAQNLIHNIVYPELNRISGGNLPVYSDSMQQTALGSSNITNILTHQGRLLGITIPTTTAALGADNWLNGTEVIYYTLADDWLNNNYTAANLGSAIFAEEIPSGIGAWASMNASEMVVIKRLGGGFVVRGDIVTPTVVKLPGLPPTYQAYNKPAVMPLGMVYGNTFSVWLWTGGDTAQDLAPQFDGWFWKPHPIVDQFVSDKGSFNYMEPYIWAPNNFIYDTKNKSWWRYGNPTKRTYAWNTPSGNGNMICAPAYIDDTQQTLCDWYSTQRGAPQYTWKSQPLKETSNKYVEVREMVLMAQGAGTITITLEGINGTQSAPEVFQFTDTERPVAIRRLVGVTGGGAFTSNDIVVNISSVSLSPSATPAPTINRITLWAHEREHLAST